MEWGRRERRDPARPTSGTGAGAEACIPERRRPVCGTPARSVESRRLRHNPISSSFSDSLHVPPLLACPSSSRPQPLARLASSLFRSFVRSLDLVLSERRRSPSLPGRTACLSLPLSISLSLRHWSSSSSSSSFPPRSFSSPDSFPLRNTRVTACFVARSAWRPVAMCPCSLFPLSPPSSFVPRVHSIITRSILTGTVFLHLPVLPTSCDFFLNFRFSPYRARVRVILRFLRSFASWKDRMRCR